MHGVELEDDDDDDTLIEFDITNCINHMLGRDESARHLLEPYAIDKNEVKIMRCVIWNDKSHTFTETAYVVFPIARSKAYEVKLNPFKLDLPLIKSDIISQALCSLHACARTESEIVVDKSCVDILPKLMNLNYFPDGEEFLYNYCALIELQLAKRLQGLPEPANSLISVYDSPHAIKKCIVIDRMKLQKNAQAVLPKHFFYLFHSSCGPQYYQYAEDFQKTSNGCSLFTLQLVTVMYAPVISVRIDSSLIS